jgi:hypothetical protein
VTSDGKFVKLAPKKDAAAARRRRTPQIWESGYLLLRSLAIQLETEAMVRLAGRGGLDIADAVRSRVFSNSQPALAANYLAIAVR